MISALELTWPSQDLWNCSSKLISFCILTNTDGSRSNKKQVRSQQFTLMIHKLYLNNFTQNLNNISQTIMVYCFSLEHVKGLLSDRPTIGNDILIQLLKQKSVFREFLVSFEVNLSFKICFRCPYRYLLLATISSLHSDVTWRVYRWIYRACLWLVDSVECIERKYWLQRSEFWYPIDLCNNRKWFIRQMRDGFWLRSDPNSQPGSYRPHAFKYLSFKSSYLPTVLFSYGQFSSLTDRDSRSAIFARKILTSRTDLF